VAFFAGPGNELGHPIPIAEAESHIFGLCLLNDWSARDIQSWEYQPLEPFLAKSFATTISPWIVTMEALAPFRVPVFARPAGDPEPLPYLSSPEDRERGAIDLTLEVYLASRQMCESGLRPMRLSKGNLRNLYWTLAQLLTHHASNGCNLQPGDLLASGTVSGPLPEERGCLLELTRRGADPIRLPTGEVRKFLETDDSDPEPPREWPAPDSRAAAPWRIVPARGRWRPDPVEPSPIADGRPPRLASTTAADRRARASASV
jgi:fumarylacetoacetase